jgi:hypothetical protein
MKIGFVAKNCGCSDAGDAGGQEKKPYKFLRVLI